MKRRINLTPLGILLVLVSGLQPVLAQVNLSLLRGRQQVALFSLFSTDTDRDRDGLVGPVRRIKTEMVKLSNKSGKMVEGQRVVLEAVAYDIKGTKIENAYYPVPGAALTGKEVYKYDDKGNIVEMTLVNADGSLLSKEVYSYEFDALGNWTKMTTSVAVIEGGKVTYEPTEVTYRSISYYLDEATLAKMSQPAQPVAAPAQSLSSVPTSGASNAAASSSQPTSVAANKSAASLPSGASLVKANMGVSGSAYNLPSSVTDSGAVVKVDGEPPPPVETRHAPKPLLKPVSGGVLNGKALMLPKPAYPQQARTARAAGVVTVEVVINEAGKVISAKAVEGHTLLRQAAVQAAQDARFSPTLLSGQPVKVSGQINYNFALQ
ncbi:MAG: periplasmic protein TonB [Acidobacteriota bacterium]|jgi:TonB family protein|nr:periplasmic protein TonB [Acidobacteriota bacterium]